MFARHNFIENMFACFRSSWTNYTSKYLNVQISTWDFNVPSAALCRIRTKEDLKEAKMESFVF